MVLKCDIETWHRDFFSQVRHKSGQSAARSVCYRIILFLPAHGINKYIFTFQVKVAILKYIESLARQMDPTDFVNSSETRLAVSRIITWTTEPKSSDVRKVSQNAEVLAVVILSKKSKRLKKKKKQSHKGSGLSRTYLAFQTELPIQ